MAGAVLLLFFASPLGSQRISRESSTNVEAAERGAASSSLAWRLDKWKILLREWESAPLVGEGLGTTITAPPIPGNSYAGEPPHNEYVRYLVETGVVGLTLLLLGLALLIRRIAGDGMRRSTGIRSREGATLALVLVTGCLVNSLADNTLLNTPTCYAAVLIVFAFLASTAEPEAVPVA